MKKRTVVSVVAAACLALGALCAIAASPALAQKGRAMDRVRVVSSVEDSSWQAMQAATRPWTREEMLSAVGLDVAAVSDDRLQQWAAQRESATVYDTEGGPGSLPGGGPNGGMSMAPGAARIEAIGPLEDLGVQQNGYSYPPPFTRYEAFPSYQIYPYQAVGRVFFTKPGGGTYACSASSIGGDGVITAAHCIHDSGSATFWTNWVFVPGYKNGQAPYGQWTANQLFFLSSYQDGDAGDERYDVGGAVLNRLSGKRLSQRVGFLGFQWNMSNSAATAHWALLGYPLEAPFSGGQQIVCQASFAYTIGPPAPSPIAVGCDQTGGTSGGPWIRSFSGVAGNSNYVNGVNAFRRCYYPACSHVYSLELFSPYFDNNAKKLRDCLVSSAPGAPAAGCR